MSRTGVQELSQALASNTRSLPLLTLASQASPSPIHITEWPELEGTKEQESPTPPPCHRQGHQPPHLIPDQAAQALNTSRGGASTASLGKHITSLKTHACVEYTSISGHVRQRAHMYQVTQEGSLLDTSMNKQANCKTEK